MLTLLMLLAGNANAEAPADKPNVVLVVWDATRPASLTPHGYERSTTPNLEAWSEGALVFEEAQTTAPWSLPSMAGIFTGLFSHNHLAGHAPEGPQLSLPQGLTTLPEAMKGAGYATGLITAQGSYYSKPGFDQGFDHRARVADGVVLESGLTFVDANQGTPLFLVLHWMNPHAPYRPEAVFDQWAMPGDPVVQIGMGTEPGMVKPGRVNSGRDNLSDKQMARIRSQYDGELLQNDSQFGQLLDALYDRGIRDNTIIVFTSTHGEAMGEHSRQLVWHDLPYDTILDVPLMIAGPGIPAGRVSTAVRTIDIYPTLLDSLKLGAAHPLNGESLLPLATSGGADRANLGNSHFVGAPTFYRGGGYKLFYSRKGEENAHLYELTTDAAEQKNIAANAKKLKTAKDLREQFIAETTLSLGF